MASIHAKQLELQLSSSRSTLHGTFSAVNNKFSTSFRSITDWKDGQKNMELSCSHHCLWQFWPLISSVIYLIVNGSKINGLSLVCCIKITTILQFTIACSTVQLVREKYGFDDEDEEERIRMISMREHYLKRKCQHRSCFMTVIHIANLLARSRSCYGSYW